MPHQGPGFYDDDQVFNQYAGLRAQRESANDTLERPLVRQMLGPVQGLDILDLGCGNADFGREMLQAGAASYLGIDGSANMVAAAQPMLAGTPGRALQAGIDTWDYPAAAFDLVVSRLALHYLPDLGAVAARVHHALRPGGRFVFSVEHPVITSSQRSDAGPAEDWIVDDYFRTGPRVVHWMGTDVVKHHRTLEDHFLALQHAGLVVEQMRESRPDRARFENEATYLKRQRIPLFLFMAARKPA